MNIPSLSDLKNSILADIQNALGTTTTLGKKVINAFSAVQAATIKLLYIQNSRVYKNIFVDTAEPEAIGGSLERFGRVKLGRDPFPATSGIYDIDVTGSIGTVIAAGTTYKSLDTSTSPDEIFLLDTEFTFVGTTGTIQVRALTLGSSARLEVNDQLQITSPLANVNDFASVSNVDTSATDVESTAEYRAEVIQSYQIEPQGGSPGDYRLWASDATGVRKVYPYVKSGYTGEVDIFVESPVSDSTDGYGTPPQSVLDEVAEVVEYDPDVTKPDNERGRRPMGTHQIHTIAVNPLSVDVEISNLSDASFISAITSAIETFLFDIRPFVGGADNIKKQNQGKLYQADMVRIVIEILGVDATFTEVVMKVSGTTQTLFVFDDGNIPYINSVTAV